MEWEYFKNWDEKVRGLKKGFKQPSAQEVKEQVRTAESTRGFNFETTRIKMNEQIKKLCGGK